MDFPKTAGIYKITNIISGKYYIGSTTCLHRRYLSHFQKLRNNGHRNSHLQNSFNKHGEQNFSFVVLENLSQCSIKEIRDREQVYLDSILDWGNCFNIQKLANICQKPKSSEETKLKQSASMRGRKSPLKGTKQSIKQTEKASKLRKVRGSDVKLKKSGSWEVRISYYENGVKSRPHLGCYKDETIARKVKSLAELVYWDNNISAKTYLEKFQHLSIPVGSHSRKRNVNEFKKGGGFNLIYGKYWRARIRVDKKTVELGVYNTQEQAAKVRSLAEILYWDKNDSVLEELNHCLSLSRKK
jgi:group I intron endonuclease